jgi:hypothetical protein
MNENSNENANKMKNKSRWHREEMSAMVFDEELLIKSRKRPEAKLTFYTDLGAYSIVNVGLFLLWYLNGQGFPWFLFVIVFWGLGVASHGVALFRQSSYFDRMTEAEYKRMLNKEY